MASADWKATTRAAAARGEPLAAIGRGQLQRPTGLARDPLTGELYVADTYNDRIRLIDRDGSVTTLATARADTQAAAGAQAHNAHAIPTDLSQEDEVKALFEQFGLDENQVHLLDQVSDMPAFYQSLDAFLIITRRVHDTDCGCFH